MSGSDFLVDEDLIRRLPLPLAQLYRHACNARSSLDRHQAACFLWEVALKLWGSAAIVEYAERGLHDPAVVEELKHLARPSLGHWRSFVRLLVPVVTPGDEGFAKLNELLGGKSRDNLPWLAGLDAALREKLEGKTGSRSTVKPAELLDRIVTYRNKVAHGGLRSEQKDDRFSAAFLAGVTELFGQMDPLAGRRMVYVDEMRRQTSGNWLVTLYDLVGETPKRQVPFDVPDSDRTARLKPGRVYLATTEQTDDLLPVLRPLHPLVLLELDEAKVLFLNAKRNKRNAEYLCYKSGEETVQLPELGQDHRELLGTILGAPVDLAALDAFAARSQAEEPEGTDESQDSEPEMLGDFELRSVLGRGGMGVVYRAWQPSLGREVAVKALQRSGDPKADARFRREIRALGKVEHPGLVKVYTSGSEGDRFFYAMELVEGADLGQVCGLLGASSSATEVGIEQWRKAVSTAYDKVLAGEQPVGPKSLAKGESPVPVEPLRARVEGPSATLRDGSYVRQIAELGRQVAEALQVLHSAGVIHRDVKPGNIMLTPDGSQAVLMDLGLAQLADDQQNLTRTRQFVGTLRYASPEQERSIDKIDGRADLYSLGATLWELLTLQPLFGHHEGMGQGELITKIQREDPPLVHTLNPAVPRDLSAIVAKCLEKDAVKRYATGDELAADIGKFLAGEPVTARPVGTIEKAWRWCRRNPVVSGSATAIAVTLLVATVVSTLFGLEARRQAGIADKSAAIARQSANTAEKAKEVALEAEQEANAATKTYVKLLHTASMADVSAGLKVMEEVAVEERESGVALGFDGMAKWREAAAHWVRALEFEPTNQTASKGLWTMLQQRGAESRLPRIESMRHNNWLRHASFSPDGSRVVTASSDNTARLWDASTGTPVGEPLQHKEVVDNANFSPDGTRVVTASFDKTARIWDASTGTPVGEPLQHHGYVVNASFSPDGTRVVTASFDKTARIWDASTGTPIGEPLPHKDVVRHASFSPDGTRVVTASSDNTARLWDASTGTPVGEPLQHKEGVDDANFSPDGTRVVTASFDKTARIWDASTGTPVGEPLQHKEGVDDANFSPDGTRIVTASWDRTARLWDASTGMPIGDPLQHGSDVYCARFSPDGRRVVTGEMMGIVRVWNASTGLVVSEPLRPEGNVHTVSFSPDGSHLLVASSSSNARIWDVGSERLLGIPLRHEGPGWDAGFSRDGTRLVTASGDMTARVWDARSGAPLIEPLLHEEYSFSESVGPDKTRIVRAGFSPDGTRVLTWNFDRAAMLWDAISGAPVGEPLQHQKDVHTALFSEDGSRVVTLGDDNTVRMWGAVTGKSIGVPIQHDAAVKSVTMSTDGTRVVTASSDNFVRLWDAASGQLLREPLRIEAAHSTYHCCYAAVNADGSRLLTMSYDSTGRGDPGDNYAGDYYAQLWDALSGSPVGAPLRQEEGIRSASFTSDGLLVLTTKLDDHRFKMGDTRQAWNAANGQPVGEPQMKQEYPPSAIFSPDGTRAITFFVDDISQSLLDIPVLDSNEKSPDDISSVLSWIRALSGLSYVKGGLMTKMPDDQRRRILGSVSLRSRPWQDFSVWAKSFGPSRLVSPLSTLTVRKVAEMERDFASRVFRARKGWTQKAHDEASHKALESALAYDPTIPLARLMLANVLERLEVSKPPLQRDNGAFARSAHLRRYDLDRLPDDAVLRKRAARVLLELPQSRVGVGVRTTTALEAADRLVATD
jgi:WD40 repeat protein/serine/threonine protein kinase